MSAADPRTAPWLRPFVPRRWLRNGHLQTIVGNYLRRRSAEALPPAERLTIPVEAPHTMQTGDGQTVAVGETSVVCLAHWQAETVRAERLTVVLVHGLEGSANSGYMLGSAALLWAQGCNVVRMNMRSCGESEPLAPTIYHSGRSGDVGCVVEFLRRQGCTRIAPVGYSMGGNMVLRYAGEQSLAAAEQNQTPAICAAAGISPLMDLAPSSRALDQPANRLYEWRFLRAMKRRLRSKARLFPQIYGSLEREGVLNRIHCMRDFDGKIVARFAHFRDADDYYEQVRASRFASTLQVPTLILQSLDDPFIRTLPETRATLLANPCVQYVETAHGGHCAFLAARETDDSDEGRWAEETLARWLLAEVCPAG